MPSPLDAQRIVNTASGYTFALWGSLTLAWLLLVVGTGLAALCVAMALMAAVFGLPRCLQTLRVKFLICPVLVLGCLGLCVLIALTVPGAGSIRPQWCMALCGFATSALTAPVVWSIARHDFAKAVPAWVCRSCGYTLIGLQAAACPECGMAFDPDRIPEVEAAAVDEARG